MPKICPICSYEAKHQGALNMHMYHCKMKNVPRETNHVSVVPGKLEDYPVRDDVCSHNWRFLNLKAPIEKKAYDGGYKEVCSKCQDLK